MSDGIVIRHPALALEDARKEVAGFEIADVAGRVGANAHALGALVCSAEAIVSALERNTEALKRGLA